MPDVAAPLPAFPADLQATYPQADLLWGVLEASLTGLALYSPLHDAAGRLTDFRIDLLNPAAQRILGQPARPAGTYLGHYPHSLDTGVFAFHRDAFESGELATLAVNYQGDGLDNYFRLSARRVGQGLLVSFTDTADAARTEVELALRASQSQAQAARAEADLQRQQLHSVLEQAPAMICIFDGPQHTFQFVNPPYQALVGNRPLVGQPIADAMPELAGQPIFGLLDQVYQTGETFYAHEMLVQLDHQNQGGPELEKRYYNFIYQARQNLAGAVDGILVFAYDVTPQVLVRQQVERAHEQVQSLNEELAATNEELHASNEEYLLTNTALQDAQSQLQQLNQALEARVAERAQQVIEQSGRLARLVQQAPAAICMLDGPALVVEMLNPEYEALFPGRQLLGQPLLEVLPELLHGPGAALLREVYETGVTFEGRELLMHLARPGGGPPESRYFDFVYQARYDAAGRINGLVLFGFEVTGRVQNRQQVQDLNEELAAMNEELQVSNEELNETNTQLTRTNVDLDNFIYTASHDLRAPISNVEGLLLALRQELPTASQVGEVPTLLRLMQDAIERFGRTIGHLTDVSRLQKEHAPQSTKVSLARVVQEVQLDLAPLIARTRAQVHVTVPDSITLLFSEKNLRSVVYNLLSNALKYHHPERMPVVHVGYQPHGAYQVLTVRDNGLGMDLVQGRDKLFAMFQRLHTHVEGTGIGLYMVKKMVENAGGRIEVQSEPDQGSTFTVYFARH
jgi:signal transduction histidine kinase